MLTPEDDSSWARQILGVTIYGNSTKQINDRFVINYTEDWEPTQFQLALEHSLRCQAQCYGTDHLRSTRTKCGLITQWAGPRVSQNHLLKS